MRMDKRIKIVYVFDSVHLALVTIATVTPSFQLLVSFCVLHLGVSMYEMYMKICYYAWPEPFIDYIDSY